MVELRENNQNVFLIQIDASSSAEFQISEFDISRFDCTPVYLISRHDGISLVKINYYVHFIMATVMKVQIYGGT